MPGDGGGFRPLYRLDRQNIFRRLEFCKVVFASLSTGTDMGICRSLWCEMLLAKILGL